MHPRLAVLGLASLTALTIAAPAGAAVNLDKTTQVKGHVVLAEERHADGSCELHALVGFVVPSVKPPKLKGYVMRLNARAPISVDGTLTDSAGDEHSVSNPFDDDFYQRATGTAPKRGEHFMSIESRSSSDGDCSAAKTELQQQYGGRVAKLDVTQLFTGTKKRS